MKLSKTDASSPDKVVDPNDPRLRYPAITLHTDEHLGCALLLVTLLPYLPLLVSVAAFDKTPKLLQSGLLIVAGLWVAAWISNIRHAGQLLRTGRPGTATVVDRFIDATGEDVGFLVVYQFEHADPDGQVRAVRGRHYCSGAHFDAPIGHTISFYALPGNRALSRLTPFWPEIWTITPPRALRARVLRWARVSAAILAVASGAAWWARAVCQAANVQWPDLLTPAGAARWRETLLSSDAAQQMWNVARQLPGVPLITVASLLVLAVAIWLTCQNSGRCMS